MKKTSGATLGFIFTTLLLDVIGIGIIIPVLPELITDLTGSAIGEAASIGGVLLFAYAFMQFLFAPILGGLSDQFGRRPILLISLFGLGVDYLLQAMAPTLLWLFIGRIIAGIMGSSHTTATAYIADISTPEKRSQNFGLVGAAFGLGFIIGPSLGGLLGQFGPRTPFYAAAGLSFLNWLFGYFILPESLEPKNRRRFEWKRANPLGTLSHLNKYPIIIGLMAPFMLVYLGGHSLQSTWSFYTIERFEWNTAMIGYSLSFVGIMVAFVQGVLIRWIHPKLGLNKSVYIGLAINVVGFILFASANQGWMMFVFTAVHTMGGIAGPALQGIMSNAVPNSEQGELQGGLTSLISLTAIVGPLIMTTLFAYFTTSEFYLPGAPFLLAAILTFISLILAYRSLNKTIP